MRPVYFFFACLICACQQGPAYKDVILSNNKYANFPRLAAASGKWLAYPEGDKILLFSSLAFGSADDSLYVSDYVGNYCLGEWKKQEIEKQQKMIGAQRSYLNISDTFAYINVERVKVFGDSLLFCRLKLGFQVKTFESQGAIAIYPLVCFDLKTKEFRKEYTVINTFDESEKTYVRDIPVTLPIIYNSEGFQYFALGYKYDSSGKTLIFSNDIDMVSIKSNVVRHVCKADSMPENIDYNIERGEILVAVSNQLLRYDKNGVLIETIETGLERGLTITDFIETQRGSYYLVYKMRSEWFVEIYEKGSLKPIFSAPYESASYKFQPWNDRFYFFYDQDAVTHAIEFK